MTPLVQSVTNLISLGAIVGQLFVVLVAAGFVLPGSTWLHKLEEKVGMFALPLTILISSAAVLGSLFYSEVAGFEPCSLCIIQRWFLYLIPLIGALGYRYDKRRALKAITILAVGAFAFALYHYVLQLQGGTTVFCTLDAPCDKVFFVAYGYITIPLLSLTNAAMLLVTCIAGLRERKLK